MAARSRSCSRSGGLPYVVKPVDITRDEQFAASFVAINPNAKIPAIVDDEAVSVFESGRSSSISREDRAFPSGGGLRHAAVADVPDGRCRADVRPGAPLPALCPGTRAVCDRTFRQRKRGGSTACSTGDSVRRSFRWRWQLFNCRHGHLSLGGTAQMAGDRFERIHECQPLVCCGRNAAGSATRGMAVPA